MKARIGFVSNSSSASFILHTNFTPDEFETLLKEEGLYDLVKEDLGVNQLGRGTLSGWTSMYNDEGDIGENMTKVRDMLINKFGITSCMITTEGEG